MSRPRFEFDSGKILLHSDGPWQEISFYDFCDLSKEFSSMWQHLIMWRRYPPVNIDPETDLSGVGFDLDSGH